LILHRISESTSEGVLERRAHDADCVKSIFQTYLKVDAHAGGYCCPYWQKGSSEDKAVEG